MIESEQWKSLLSRLKALKPKPTKIALLANDNNVIDGVTCRHRGYDFEVMDTSTDPYYSNHIEEGNVIKIAYKGTEYGPDDGMWEWCYVKNLDEAIARIAKSSELV